MAEYIERDGLIAWIERQKRLAKSTTIIAIQDTPAADVVEVVRCKDCKYWENAKDYEPYCNHWGNMMTDTTADDYCSCGERKG